MSAAPFDLNTPEGRLAAVEALGPAEYNAAMRKAFAANRITVVNGHALRRVASRYGQLIMVGATGTAFRNLDAAESFARAQKPGKDG
jgi:hypothetical protein